MKQVPTFKMKLNSQDPRIINAREAINTAHKAIGKKTKLQSKENSDNLQK